MDPYSLVLIALMVVAFYLLIIRPNKKRQQAQQQTMNSLTPGTRVLLVSGIFGTVVEVGDRQAVLELSPGVQMTVLKPAIARLVQPSDEDTVEDDDYDEADGSDASATPLSDTTGSHATTDTTVHHTPASPNGVSRAISSDQDPRTQTSNTPIKD